MTFLSLGDKAPQFTLRSNDEKEINLLELKGSKVVLYFYPKDNTSGCTAEALDFSKWKSEFDKESTIVIGISPDSIESHKKFHQKNNLSIILLSDESKETLQAYDVWKEKSMFGKKYMGVVRTTFLINEKGIIVKIWNPVKLKNHAQSVLKMVESLKQK
ncbi:thioredoxin-dependent thiol peroxidase [Candidatus Liberibacter africanus]|uniref:thioredoxin-dependent peroxiredoxin n=1 Tax=Candidatus Liberibacter africanus PTSAPSY TaxID=1277257 RepID=A0A0G3I1J0_LIBAF|nr:thioredoxin-dependent thiol peroxidase [Candidatus Liberibacter africanus]AKK19741.1 bacterioferritin comigratory protein [Candidatus Liberibacter africanus PTSAPSY]QTP63621.1 thioredoxin-dependent thiol peroxidase [Candidatus Liberibacter africanus]